MDNGVIQQGGVMQEAGVMRGIEAYMQAHMGLHGSTISDDTVARAVRQRIKELGLSDSHDGHGQGGEQTLADYLLLLQQSQRETDQLSELLVVPETWFFRYHKSFDFIRQQAKAWLTQYGRPLPILSLPCATGEEPYSIAMCLLDAGLSVDCFRIDAVDISAAALIIAKQAEYGGNSFRNEDVSFRQRYCTVVDDGYRINALVRSTVHFSNYNIMQEGGLPRPSYALVFCRNLLIYFDPPTQQQVLKKMGQLLYSDGLLFVGHGDTGPVHSNKDFDHVDTAAFVYRKHGPATHQPSDRASPLFSLNQAQSPKLGLLAQLHQSVAATTVISKKLSKPARQKSQRQPAVAPESDLAVVRRQADAEQLTEAASNCQHYLYRHGHDVDGWALMGIIYAAQNKQAEALQALNKAVYLDSGHAESLTHLALLADQMGKPDAALRFRKRLARASAQSGAAS